jgi:hypothetical protein
MERCDGARFDGARGAPSESNQVRRGAARRLTPIEENAA